MKNPAEKIFEEEMEVKNFEQKKMIRLVKREEHKIRQVLIKLGDEKKSKKGVCKSDKAAIL